MKPENLKIDLVYMWVDGEDPKWIARKNSALKKAGRPIHKSATLDKRFIQFDELKYSLRSAEKFAPWINHIFIITDGQVPKWLDTKNKKITIIDHKDIIPAKYLPTFNSSAIELFLHKIPGLSEHFLLSNDDMMFGAKVTPDFFFDENGNPIVIMRPGSFRRKSYYERGADDLKENKSDMFSYMSASVAAYVYKKTGVRYRLAMTHAIEPMRKSYLADILDNDWDTFLKTTATQFREKTNIQRKAFPLINATKQRTKLVYPFSFFGHRIKARNNLNKYVAYAWLYLLSVFEIYNRDFEGSSYSASKAMRHIKAYKPKIMAINEIRPRQKKHYFNFMNKMFPEKSEFEK